MQKSRINLTPFEHYMLADDSAEHPMCFFIRLRVEGVVDRESFDKSVAQSLHRHPLLRAMVEGEPHRPTKKLKWSIQSTCEGAVSWMAPNFHDGQERCYQSSINLRHEIGTRVYVAPDQDATTVVFQFHHACVDAIGALQFIDDILVHYQHAIEDTGGTEPSLKRLDPERIHARGSLGVSKWEWVKRTALDTKRIAYFFKTSADPIERSADKGAFRFDQDQLPDWPCEILDTSDLTRLLATSRRHQVTANDIMLYAMFLTIEEWNQKFRSGAERSIRIGIATNLRLPQDDTMSAANVVSMVFLTRTSNEIHAGRNFLLSVHEETRRVKEFRMGLALCRVVAMCGRVANGMKILLRRRDCYATAIFSNLGVTLHEHHDADHSMQVRSIELIPPVRQGTDIVVGALTFGANLHLTMNFNRMTFPEKDAVELLSAFKHRILSLCGD